MFYSYKQVSWCILKTSLANLMHIILVFLVSGNHSYRKMAAFIQFPIPVEHCQYKNVVTILYPVGTHAAKLEEILLQVCLVF